MTGTEIAIEWQGRRARAFVPYLLSSRRFEPSVVVARASEQAAAAVRRVGDRLPRGWEPIARLLLRAEGVASSNIEGLRAPVADVAAAEIDADVVPHEAALVADNLAVVTDALDHAHGSARLTTDDLHRWHARLTRHSDLPPEMVGHFRTAQSWIGGRSPLDAAFVPPPAKNVARLMRDLVAFTNGTKFDVVTQAAVSHAQFETIHPYGDGNGRIGRLLVLWLFARRLDVAVPPPTSVLIARDPGGYLSGLHFFRNGDDERWVRWFADIVTASAASALDWAREVDALMHDWHDRIGDVRADAAARKLVDVLPAHPVLNVETAASLVKVTGNAARKACRVLQDRRILEPYAPNLARRGRPAQWWYAPELGELVPA
jgi:Fic family protein